MTRGTSIAGVEKRIEASSHLPRAALAEQWQRLYRSNPPKGVSRRFLIAAIAHALQLRAHGRTASSLRRRIERVAAKRSRSSDASPTNIPTVGARLIREWNGSTYTVDVTEDGFIWDGVAYRSLSVIARTITGTRWSGPRFFGLSKEAG